MQNIFDKILNCQQLSEKTGLTVASIVKMKLVLIEKELAHQFGGTMVYHIDAVDFIKSRPEKRGRKRAAKK